VLKFSLDMNFKWGESHLFQSQ